MPPKSLKCSNNFQNISFKAQAHQTRVANEFLETNNRGLLFYHALGSGKTCAAYLAIDLYRNRIDKKKVIILAPASLASSHQHQYCSVCGEHPSEFENDFQFYSYNDRQHVQQKLPSNIRDSIIIVDEVQEVLNGKENNSKSLVHVYNSVLNSKNCKIILLSGTPVFSAFQASLLLNLLSPGITSMNKDVFTKAFENIRDPDYLFLKCKGLISYVPIPDETLYPKRILPDIVDVFEMSEEQFGQYSSMREKEINDLKDIQTKLIQAQKNKNVNLISNLKPFMFINQTHIRSRQICNFAYPIGVSRNLETDKDASWILNDDSDIHIQNLKKYSPKMRKLIQRCLTLPGKHMVYAWFKNNNGLYLIDAYLRHCGLNPLIFSGDLSNDKARHDIIEKFNSPDNIRGEKHKVILVSGAGAMGISLFGIRHFHNFESQLNEFTSIQAEGRAFRTNSHHQLPVNERNVQVYRYFTDLPKVNGKPRTVENETTSTEMQMYRSGLIRMKQTQKVLDIMRRASFDCRESYNSAIHSLCFNFEDVKSDEKSKSQYMFDGVLPFNQNEQKERVEETFFEQIEEPDVRVEEPEEEKVEEPEEEKVEVRVEESFREEINDEELEKEKKVTEVEEKIVDFVKKNTPDTLKRLSTSALLVSAPPVGAIYPLPTDVPNSIPSQKIDNCHGIQMFEDECDTELFSESTRKNLSSFALHKIVENVDAAPPRFQTIIPEKLILQENNNVNPTIRDDHVFEDDEKKIKDVLTERKTDEIPHEPQECDHDYQNFNDFLTNKKVHPNTAFFLIAGHGGRRNEYALQRAYPKFIQNSKASHTITVRIDDYMNPEIPDNINGELYDFNEFLPSAPSRRDDEKTYREKHEKIQKFEILISNFVKKIKESGGIFIFVNYVSYRLPEQRVETFSAFPWLKMLKGSSIILEWTYNSHYLSIVNTPIRFKYTSDSFVVKNLNSKVVATCDSCEKSYVKNKRTNEVFVSDLTDIDNAQIEPVILNMQDWRYKGNDEEPTF